MAPPSAAQEFAGWELRRRDQMKSIWKIQPAVGLSLLGQPGWMPASQLISLPSNIARPCGSQEFGTKSTVSSTLPVAASYLTRQGRYSLYRLLSLPTTCQMVSLSHAMP